MTDILKMIENALAEGFADEEVSDMVNAIQDSNRARMERAAQTRTLLAKRPAVVLNGEMSWHLGGGRYAVMTGTGEYREETVPPGSPKPGRL